MFPLPRLRDLAHKFFIFINTYKNFYYEQKKILKSPFLDETALPGDHMNRLPFRFPHFRTKPPQTAKTRAARNRTKSRPHKVFISRPGQGFCPREGLAGTPKTPLFPRFAVPIIILSYKSMISILFLYKKKISHLIKLFYTNKNFLFSAYIIFYRKL